MTSSFERQNLFIDAFGRPPEKALPTAVTGSRWRYNLEKVKKLSFAEKLKLQEFHDRGTPFYELPSWVLDGGFIQISKAEQKKQDQLTNETGLTQTERATVFNAFNAHMASLVEMSKREILRESEILKTELDEAIAKYGEVEVMTAINEIDGESGEFYAVQLRMAKAEKQLAQINLKKQEDQTSIANELAEAKAAIESGNAQLMGISELPSDLLKDELFRMLNNQARKNAEESE